MSPVERIDMMVDISKTGKLVEMGMDPFTRAPENKAAATQTEGGGNKSLALDPVPLPSVSDAIEMVAPNGEIVKLTDSSSSQVLRLAVGLLGMEVHEAPHSWAESWLTFQDKTFANLGLGSKKASREESGISFGTPSDWQMDVLNHLREHVNSRPAAVPDTDDSSLEHQVGGHDWGPDFPEHLDLAEFALGRIAHCVGVLEDPEKHDRPILLREYTEEMVLKVAQDLRSWLQQLGTLIGVYHVHLLDLQAERCKLAKLLEEHKAQLNTAEEERKSASRNNAVMKEHWEAEKMKRDAERLLGIKMAGEDAKIYSQKEVDEMYKQWEIESLDPVLAELRELRLAREGLQDKLKHRPKHEVGHQDKGSAGVTLDKAATALLVGIIDAASEKVPDNMSKIFSRWGNDVAKGGHNLQGILGDIRALPEYAEPARIEIDRGLRDPSDPGGDHPALECIDSLEAEFSRLESVANGCPSQNGAEKLGSLGAWAKDIAKSIRASLLDGGKSIVRFVPPPQWDLGILGKVQSGKQYGGGSAPPVVQTVTVESSGNEDAIRASVEAEWKAKIDKMRRDLEVALREANERAEQERRNAQEAMQRLEEEMAKADATLAELRRKIAMLEALLREKGLGKSAADAIWGAGLSDFMQGRDVFERLYRDALDRMKRLAESQAKFFKESSTEFLRSVGAIVDPNLRLPGLDPSFYSPSDASLGTPPGSPLPRGMPIGAPLPHEYRMPRSAGGAMRSGSPGRSLSPPSSPSGRGVQSAPSRMNDPLNVNRLLTSASGTALMRPSRSELSSRQLSASAQGFTRRNSLRGQPDPDPLLSITSSSSPPNHGMAMRRPQTQQYVSQFAKGKPMHMRSTGSNFGDGRTLPPLECKGQGRSNSRSQSPHDDLEGRMNKMKGGLRAGSPTRDVSADKERMERALFLTKSGSSDPLLSIGSVRPGGVSAPSGLLPPDMRQDRAVIPKVARPGTHGGAARMARQGGSASMPQLGMPRLLVQSVGAAY